ncbi:MAG TPA: glycosyltransferase, partial [Clostridia bacterium]
MVWIIAIATITGYNFFFWSVVSFVRFITEYKLFPPKEKIIFYSKYKISDIAAIIPAHNEEKTIRRTLSALLKIIPKKNIYVASDNSTDRTNKIVRTLH